jgi:hypothetical protein
MRLDAEQFAIYCSKRGIPAEYWPDGLAVAESLSDGTPRHDHYGRPDNCSIDCPAHPDNSATDNDS